MLPAALALRETFDVAHDASTRTVDLRLVKTTPAYPNEAMRLKQLADQTAEVEFNIANGIKPQQHNSPVYFSGLNLRK